MIGGGTPASPSRLAAMGGMRHSSPVPPSRTPSPTRAVAAPSKYSASPSRLSPMPAFGTPARTRDAPAAAAPNVAPRAATAKALLIGINYKGQNGELRGCINDVKNISRIVTEFGSISKENVMILTDETKEKPTKKNILAGMDWLTRDARAGDRLFFHYSGHGTQVPNTDDDDEEDHMNEALVPIDHNNCSNLIVDSEVSAFLFDRIPNHCSLTVIMDCCHSGTMIDDLHVAGGKPLVQKKKKQGARSMGRVSSTAADSDSDSVLSMDPNSEEVREHFKLPPGARARHLPPPASLLRQMKEQHGVSVSRARAAPMKPLASNEGLTLPNPHAGVLLFSGCRDHQTSADAYIDGQYTGALSWALCKTLKEAGCDLSYEELIERAAQLMKDSDYEQDPLLSTKQSHLLSTKFMQVSDPAADPAASAAAAAPPPSMAATYPAAGSPGSKLPLPSMSAFPTATATGYGGSPLPGASPGPRPSLGMLVDNAPYNSGVQVLEVRPGSIAALCGLRKADAVEAVGTVKIKNTIEFREVVSSFVDSGQFVPLAVRRGTGRIQIVLRTDGSTPPAGPSAATSSPAAAAVTAAAYTPAPAAPPSLSLSPLSPEMQFALDGGADIDVASLPPTIGITVVSDPSGRGVTITNVARDSTGFLAGLRVRDVIERVARRPTPDKARFLDVMDAVANVGVMLPMVIRRGPAGSKAMTLNVEVEAVLS